ncbi:MAG TPA: phosphatase PAP2 family protein [Gemmatimonadota bacterium]|nr:phosphatase PAP2 family protein [Gemmatimonadota bacterium]
MAVDGRLADRGERGGGLVPAGRRGPRRAVPRASRRSENLGAGREPVRQPAPRLVVHSPRLRGGTCNGAAGSGRGLGAGCRGFLATGLVTQTLKWVVGRPRPDLGPDADELRPGSFDNDHQAWPSGHVSTAFSIATSVAMESDRAWVGAVAYGLAGVTAWSRIYADRHWTSDVVAGAVIGTIATRTTIRWLEARQAGGAALAVGPGGATLTLPVP